MARKPGDPRTYPASGVQRRLVEWLWKEHIPYGMISMIAGWPEKGKSTLMSRIAADVSHKYPVIMSTYEDAIAEIAFPRLEAAGANLDNIHFWKGGILLPTDMAALRREIDTLGAMLVVMDPAASHTTASIYHATNIRTAFGPLVEIADDTDAAMVFVHHLIKKVDLKADPLAAVGGAGGGLSAMIRVAYLFGESPDDPDERMLVHLKCNIAPPRVGLKFELDVLELDDDVDAPFLEYRGTHSLSADKVFTARPKLNPEKMELLAEWLVANLREGPMNADKIMEGAIKAGFTKRMTGRVVDLLEIEKVKKKWKLPEGFPDVA